MRHAFLFAAAFSAAVAGQRPAPAADPLIVHEWGTFTSVQGSDGVSLEGLQTEEEELPRFVYSRTKVRECPLRQAGYKGLEVPATHVTQKMETPVLYFHTKSPRRVRVRVDFVGGLITQWYPVSNLVGPPENARDAGPLDISKVKRSFLEWDADLVPAGADTRPEIPWAAETDPWTFARRVDSAYVRTLPRAGAGRLGPVEAEKYLFYRGLGTFRLPIAVEASAGGKARVKNGGDHAITAAIAVEMGPEQGRITGTFAVPARGEASVDLALSRFRPKADVQKDLRETLTKLLLLSGLRADESTAMVDTWARQWFASEGVRLLYIVPRPVTDALLPLQIQPTPDEVVRTLVGRLEYLTPEIESEVECALVDGASSDSAVRAAATSRLNRLGRFLEPHVRRIESKSPNPAARSAASAALRALTN